MIPGTVKFFDLVKGFGYIQLDMNVDVYVHRRAIRGDGFRYLAAGERVQVEFEWDAERNEQGVSMVEPYGERMHGVVTDYDHLKGYGFIRSVVDEASLFVHHSQILGQERRKSLEVGEEVEFNAAETERGLQAVSVKRADPRPPFARFAFMGSDRRWLTDLASLAEAESWDYYPGREPDGQPRYAVLRSYFTHTFMRVQQQGRIGYSVEADKRLACFNTGLVTSKEEEVFALFEGNPMSESTGTPWKLLGFVRQSDRQLLNAFRSLPEMAQYYDEPAHLIFDPRKPLHIDYEHVIEDHLERFPESMRGNPHVAQQCFATACVLAQRRVRRNHRTAIPQFHRGELQLLLPLCLESPERVDLALVVSRVGDHYRGDTVLTLEMAYNNARLISRPNSEWLVPEVG